MLKLKYLFENYALAKEALKNWKHDEANLDETLSGFRISSNAIYPFCEDGQVCFLRLAPVEEKEERNVSGELEFIRYLRGKGYPALEPVLSITGKDCLKLSTEWGAYYAAVFRKVGGVPVEDTDMSGPVMRAYGKALGRLHALSEAYEPRVKKWSHEEALDWIASALTEYGAPEGVVFAQAALRQELSALPARRDTYGLVHYDFEPDNVFYSEETQTCSVIDFDDGMYHWFALDIEQVFDSLRGALRGEALLKAKKEFIKGYEEERPYTEEMEASLPLMRRFVDLFSYARLIRCVAEKFPEEPPWLGELRIKLNRAILEKERNILKA